ncbi:MAG: trigger factor [Algoriphagus sp.]|uniref:trigger factor n=1 Tax=Algoriphagus sp. TaxID=1872435 RepID=UPI0027314B2C|nr:trigger factor [Algoriphagus sp.]MDP2040988.1 trigger factor [Algoriphagus sp.]MDP3470540.1 trigger factor [Algoriphagus sp.]
MEITLDKHSANQASIKITLNEADYQPKVDAKLKDYAKKAVIKGFRPGKAPIAMVKGMYGVSLLVDEINALLGESLNNYLKEQTFRILGEPLPVEKADNSIDWKTQKDFDFEYKIGFVESVNIALDATTKGTKYSIKVDEKLINETLDNLKSQYGNSTNPEVSEANDNIYGDLKASEGDFSKTISLPLSKISKKLAGKFIGLSKDAVVEFDAKEVKKEEWSEAFGLTDEEIAEAKGAFTFTIVNINRTEAAELNQEFFDKIFGPEAVSTEEEFINKVKETLQGSYDRESKVFSDEELKKVLVQKANLDLPDAFLKEWLVRANEGKVSEADVENEYPIYAKQLTWSLISNQIAKDNSIKAEHEDVIEKTKEMVREQFASSGLGAQLEASMDMFVDNYLKGNEGQNYMNMMTSVQNEKVLAFVQEKIDLVEKEISIDEFKELLEK